MDEASEGARKRDILLFLPLFFSLFVPFSSLVLGFGFLFWVGVSGVFPISLISSTCASGSPHQALLAPHECNFTTGCHQPDKDDEVTGVK